MRVFVDSACDVKYASFYIEGLRQVLGKQNVHFDSKRFSAFSHNNFYVPIEIESAGKIYKVIIDFADWPTVKPLPYEWCDLYCKINIPFDYDGDRSKLLTIGPGFGIRVFNIMETVSFAVANLIKSGNRIGKKKRFLYDYYGQFRRPTSADYKNSAVNSNYIFFASSLWKSDTATNDFRANFIRACRSIPGITFFGGFAPRYNNDIPGYEDLTLKERVATDEYIAKTKKSLVAFNTPAVAQCHGWKLGEFLAMGKAIISTPLSRVLPEQLTNGVHLLITDGTRDDIAKKILQIRDDDRLRTSLESQSRAYYDRHLSPRAVVRSILKELGINSDTPVR